MRVMPAARGSTRGLRLLRADGHWMKRSQLITAKARSASKCRLRCC